MIRLNETMDAEEWAKQFVDKVKNKTVNPESIEQMKTWFANAIMVGYDRARPVNGDQAESMMQGRQPAATG